MVVTALISLDTENGFVLNIILGNPGKYESSEFFVSFKTTVVIVPLVEKILVHIVRTNFGHTFYLCHTNIKI